jgi:TonB family protein
VSDIGGGDQRVPTHIPKLIFPDFLLYQGMEGKVLVSIEIDKYGNVSAAKVICSEPNEAFNLNAIEYLQRWKFEPSEEITKNQTQLIVFSQNVSASQKYLKCGN